MSLGDVGVFSTVKPVLLNPADDIVVLFLYNDRVSIFLLDRFPSKKKFSDTNGISINFSRFSLLVFALFDLFDFNCQSSERFRNNNKFC